MSAIHLVTGGSGYFGGVLVNRLRARGERVRIFDLNDTPDRPAEVEFVRGDIRNLERVREAMRDVAIVHHNVAQVPLAKDRHLFWSVNEGGTENLLKAARDAGVRKVVNTSSSAIFGAPDHNPVMPSTKPAPQEEYGRAKLAGEELCRKYVREGLDVSIVRPRTIMGHGRLGIMQIIFEWVRQGRNIPVLDGGRNIYQFVHADDLADACILAADRPGSETFNIGTDRFGTMRETLEGLIRHAGTKSRIVSLPMKPAIMAMQAASRLGVSPLGPYHWLMYGRSMYFDLEYPKTTLKWSPRWSNVEMFCQSYDWYLTNRDKVLAGRTASIHSSAVQQGVLEFISRWW